MMKAVWDGYGEPVKVAALAPHHDDSGVMNLEIVPEEQCVQMLDKRIFSSRPLLLRLLASFHELDEFGMDTVILLKTFPRFQLQEWDLACIFSVDVDVLSVGDQPDVVPDVLFLLQEFAYLTLTFAVWRRIAGSMVDQRQAGSRPVLKSDRDRGHC